MTSKAPLLLVLCWFASLAFTPTEARAQSTVYEILPGSHIVDECVPCGQPPVVREIVGSFTLEVLPSFVCCIFAVRDLEFSDTAGEQRWSGRGEGTYGTSEIGEVTQSMNLQLTIGQVENVQLASGNVAIGTPFPAIEISLTEDGTRDPNRRFSMRILAAPKANEAILYEIVPGDADGEVGSYFDVDCPACFFPFTFIPIKGSFILARLSHPANPLATYQMRDIDIQNARPPEEFWELDAFGRGTYQQGGEVALQQNAVIHLDIDGDDVTLVSRAGPVPRDTPFPEISFVAPQSAGIDAPFIYSLRLHARPAQHVDVEFRRGDSNGDGDTDIADAVHLLSWQFSGGAVPACLEAADTNFDGDHNLTDGIFLLAFLFQGGQEPPAPGPKECGISRAPTFDCLEYSHCEA